MRRFHAAALAAGYEDHGAPGERAVYHPGYYGALVLNPDSYYQTLIRNHGSYPGGHRFDPAWLHLEGPGNRPFFVRARAPGPLGRGGRANRAGLPGRGAPRD